MKKFINLLFLFAIVMLFSSCSDEVDDTVNSPPRYLSLKILIVDNDLNDLLNPESQEYIGDDIKLFYYYESGKRFEYIRLVDVRQGVNVEVERPAWSKHDFYYFRHVYDFHNGENVIMKIRYADGSEDEIKTFIPDNSWRLKTIWINDVLVFDFDSHSYYYNPDYYIWSDAKNYFVPKYGMDNIVIKKDLK